MRILSFKEAIREAQEEALADASVILIGEGVDDPKRIFSTTSGLKEKFPLQVFDSPVSENGVTGVCIGAAINGLKPILVHQRMDFSLYSMDQIVNNAAKIHSMFGGQLKCPMVIRMIIGRGWGAGNQHSQNLTAMFAHVPGLKVVFPTNARDAKRLFLEAVRDPNPVIFVEHRWLYETTADMDEEVDLILHTEPDMTIVAIGHCAIEARKAREAIGPQLKINIVDLQVIKPIGEYEVFGRNFIVVDDAWDFGGLANQIALSMYHNGADWVGTVTNENWPSGSSPALTKDYYPTANDIIEHIEHRLGLELPRIPVADNHDVPDANFRGPF